MWPGRLQCWILSETARPSLSWGVLCFFLNRLWIVDVCALYTSKGRFPVKVLALNPTWRTATCSAHKYKCKLQLLTLCEVTETPEKQRTARFLQGGGFNSGIWPFEWWLLLSGPGMRISQSKQQTVALQPPISSIDSLHFKLPTARVGAPQAAAACLSVLIIQVNSAQ